MNKPTNEQIQEQIEFLKAIKPNVPVTTLFGDNNHAAIDAQIHVLRDNVSEDSVYAIYAADEATGTGLSIRNAALEARQWLDGEYEDYPSLVEGWAELAEISA